MLSLPGKFFTCFEIFATNPIKFRRLTFKKILHLVRNWRQSFICSSQTCVQVKLFKLSSIPLENFAWAQRANVNKINFMFLCLFSLSLHRLLAYDRMDRCEMRDVRSECVSCICCCSWWWPNEQRRWRRWRERRRNGTQSITRTKKCVREAFIYPWATRMKKNNITARQKWWYE